MSVGRNITNRFLGEGIARVYGSEELVAPEVSDRFILCLILISVDLIAAGSMPDAKAAGKLRMGARMKLCRTATSWSSVFNV